MLVLFTALRVQVAAPFNDEFKIMYD